VRVLSVIVLSALVACDAGAAITRAQSRPPTNPTPQLPPAPGVSIQGMYGRTLGKRPKPLDRPSARFSLLFLQYRHGDAETAIDALAKWSEAELIVEAVQSPNDDEWTRAALAIFLTEAGIRNARFGVYSDYSPKWILDRSWGLDNIYEIHSYKAYTIVKDLSRAALRKHDDKLLSFCLKWYDYVTSYVYRLRKPALINLRDIADHDLGEYAEIRLLLGSMMETAMGPGYYRVDIGCGGALASPDGCVPQPGGGSPTQQAAYLLSHAIKKDPTLAEAHLRLAHVLHLKNLPLEARPHLDEAKRLALEQKLPYLVYMANLFLGDLEEHDGHYPQAIAFFREAVAADPTAHIANIALGEALLKSGDRAGFDEARRMFDDEDQTHPKKLDPWFYYRYAQYWRLAPGLRELRQMARVID
jgi:tetratricopeptide (TPR) repeat protein